MACRKEAHVYGPSLSKQDDWNTKSGTIAGTAPTQEYLLLHLAMFPIGLHAWSNVIGMPTAHQLQAQIIYRAKKVLEFGPVTPAHRKPPWPGYEQGLRFFTKLLSEHPLVGICRPPNPLPAETLKASGYRGVQYTFEVIAQAPMQEWCGKRSWLNSPTLKEEQYLQP